MHIKYRKYCREFKCVLEPLIILFSASVSLNCKHQKPVTIYLEKTPPQNIWPNLYLVYVWQGTPHLVLGMHGHVRGLMSQRYYDKVLHQLVECIGLMHVLKLNFLVNWWAPSYIVPHYEEQGVISLKLFYKQNHEKKKENLECKLIQG